MVDKLRIYENLRTVAYAPFYFASVSGEFAAQGLAPEIVTAADPTETAAGLLAGRVDVSWGGPMRVMLHHDRDPACPLVCFCQVVARDPFYLLGRSARPGFRFTDLRGLRLGVTNEVPTPWMTFQDDVRRAGIEPGDLRRIADASMAELARALEAGAVDVIQVSEPHANQLIDSGAGHLWHTFANRGDLGFTSFYTTRQFVVDRPDTCAALTRALHNAIGAMLELAPADIAGHIASYFPAIESASLAACLARYLDSGLWSRSTLLTPSAYVRLKAALLSGGLIERDVPFESVIDNRFAIHDGQT